MPVHRSQAFKKSTHIVGKDAHIDAQIRQQKLNGRREEKSKQLQNRLDAWFKEFDTNDNGELERDELSALLLYLHPEHPPDNALLDMLIEKATAVESFSISLRGSKDGTVSRMAAQKTVQTYDAYIRQKKKLDEIFTTHDADNSGKLDRGEVLNMMTAIISETRGLTHVKAAEGDVDYLMSTCDQDGDAATVTREELLPALALWKELAQQKDATERELVSPLKRAASITGRPMNESMKSGSRYANESMKSGSRLASKGVSGLLGLGGDARDAHGEGRSQACAIL